MTSRRSEPFWGELYLRSTRPFLSAKATSDERAFLARCFAGAQGPVVDLGCGHGRHLFAQPPGFVGVDFDRLSLEEARTCAPCAQADFFRLPLRSGAMGGAYGWYNALLTFEDERQQVLFAEVARALKPGARFVVPTLPRGPLEAEPEARFDGALPDGSHLLEIARFDARTGKDHTTRTLTTPDGRVMTATYFIRYYFPDELLALLEAVGFRADFMHGAADGRPLGADATDLIVGVRRG